MSTGTGKWPAGFPPGFDRKFAPERMLGRGSFGSVWLARQLPLDRRVALKVLHEEVLADEAEVGRFTDEARITAALSHPHVVVVLDHGVEAGVPWIAYEYLEGPSLRARLTGDALPWREAVTAAVQVLDALDHAHQRGILHRDIKPDNVIEVQPGHYKVADFGLAKLTSQRRNWTATGAVVGSPAYMSPEQIDGFEPRPASDQYALGVMLFELLTGKLPFYETDDMPVMVAHLKLAPPKPCDLRPQLPRVLDLLLERALAKKPEERFGSVAELKVALESVLRGEASSVMVRMRSRVDRRTKLTGNLPVRPATGLVAVRPGTGLVAVRPATGLVAATPRRRPGPLWWAAAFALPVVAGVAFGAHAYRAKEAARIAQVSAAPFEEPVAQASFKELQLAAQPPRAVRVRYELDHLPPAGWPLAVEVNGVARLPVKLTSVLGSLLVTGIAPGSLVKVGAQELTTPRAVPAWIDALPADTHASVTLRFLEPTLVDLTVIERASGKVIFQKRTARGASTRQSITGLKPGTRYTVRVKVADDTHFLPAALTEHEFTTLTAAEAAPARAEIEGLRSKDEADHLRAANLTRVVPDPDVAPLAAAALTGKKMLAEFDTALQLMTTMARLRDPRLLPGYSAALAAAPNAPNRAAVLQQIGEIQDPAGFDVVLKDCALPGLAADEETATIVAEALLASDPARATETFLKASNDPGHPPSMLARAAIEGLARLGGAEAVAALGRLARAAPRELGPRAAAALGALGTEAARAELVALLSGGARPGEAAPATEGALRALARCGRPDDAGAVLALLKAPLGARLKRAAITALAGAGGAEAEAEVARLVSDADPGVALAACWAAGQRRVRAAVPALILRLRAPGGTAGRAPRALGAIGDPAAAAPLLELVGASALLTSPGQVLDRAEALWALGVLGERRALPALLRCARAGDLYTRYRAVEALGWLGDPGARSVLEELARDPVLTLPVKEAAAKSLRWLAEGRKPRAGFFNVDPAFPPVRTGLILAMGESFQTEAQGVCLLDPIALAAPADPANLPTGSRPARAALLGLVGAAGHCFAGRGETSPCAHASEGELVFYALRAEPDEKAAGFLTVWLKP